MMKGSITLIISNDVLNMIELKKFIKLKPTRFINKGDLLLLNKIADCDRWIYEKKFSENDMEQVIDTFFERLCSNNLSVKDFIKTVNVNLKIGIVSEYGQIGFSLTNNQISVIQSLGLHIDFDIISFGMVD